MPPLIGFSLSIGANIVRNIYGSGSGGGPSPALNIDLTSNLDSRITFTRAGSRNYINAGVLTTLASSNVPAFESWDGVARGMSIEPAFTNILTHSNDPTQAVWTKSGGGVAAGDVGDGLITQLYQYNATATSAYHVLKRETSSIAAGTTQTLTCYVKTAAGATNYSVHLRLAAQYDNNGYRNFFRIDGTGGVFPVEGAGYTNGWFGYKKLSGGIYQLWVKVTWSTTSNKELNIGVTADALLDNRFYTAATTDSFQIFGAQLASANGPTGYVATGAATASQAGESAVFNDSSWLTTAQGTFVVEHDCWSGPLIGSGANTVLGATLSGKTAIAWDGATSDTVNNGGGATAGGLPTFSGSDIRLLATTGTTNAGHIKSIKFYNTRLSVAQLQELTAPVIVSTATPNVLRGASSKNRLPSVALTTSGTTLNFAGRFEVPIASGDLSEIRLDFPNVYFPGVSAGNALIIDECYLERVTGVAESVQVKVAGSGTFTVADGSATAVVSDVILPTAFTGMTKFNLGDMFCIRIRGKVSTAGHKIVASRSRYDSNAFNMRYDPAVTSPTAVSGTGAMTYSGSVPLLDDYGYCPILVGKFVSGDPKTCFTVGDSITEGITGISHQGPGLYIKKACMALGIANLEHSKGGTSQREVSLDTNWTPYLKYARVLIDAMGTNNLNAQLDFFTYWSIAKTTYGYDKLVTSGLTPVTTSSDSFVTEENQLVSRAYPHNHDVGFVAIEKFGAIDKNHVPFAARGANPAKWIVNGTVGYATGDGTHPTPAADDLMAAEFQPVLDAITVT